ncbi:hypothetical protein GWI33_019648 [Rhynchophorus ferrugineus]|uniref:Uncharacterized protein n=1 Tax=Rhynchophorus ferrugineus TaxID=354439 RepID=A0A834HXX1_RHYFE|nr:hypothetical protein GWI33_019648 [Rhynchophorus ferrugineus]
MFNVFGSYDNSDLQKAIVIDLHIGPWDRSSHGSRWDIAISMRSSPDYPVVGQVRPPELGNGAIFVSRGRNARTLNLNLSPFRGLFRVRHSRAIQMVEKIGHLDQYG